MNYGIASGCSSDGVHAACQRHTVFSNHPPLRIPTKAATYSNLIAATIPI